jgi:hypothetical protein
MEKTFEAYMGGKKLSNFSFDAYTYRYYRERQIQESTQGLRHYKVQDGTIDILINNIHMNNSPSKIIISGEDKGIKTEVQRIKNRFGFKLEEIIN